MQPPHPHGEAGNEQRQRVETVEKTYAIGRRVDNSIQKQRGQAENELEQGKHPVFLAAGTAPENDVVF